MFVYATFNTLRSSFAAPSPTALRRSHWLIPSTDSKQRKSLMTFVQSFTSDTIDMCHRLSHVAPCSICPCPWNNAHCLAESVGNSRTDVMSLHVAFTSTTAGNCISVDAVVYSSTESQHSEYRHATDAMSGGPHLRSYACVK